MLVEWSCAIERLNERETNIFVEWWRANKRNKSVRTLVLLEWSCTKKIINERGPYISVKWSCAHKRNKSLRIIIFGRLVVHKRNIK